MDSKVYQLQERNAGLWYKVHTPWKHCAMLKMSGSQSTWSRTIQNRQSPKIERVIHAKGKREWRGTGHSWIRGFFGVENDEHILELVLIDVTMWKIDWKTTWRSFYGVSIVLLRQTMAIHIKTHRNTGTEETFLDCIWRNYRVGEMALTTHPRTHEKVEGGTHLCKVVLCPPHAHCVNNSHTHWKYIPFKRRGKCSTQPQIAGIAAEERALSSEGWAGSDIHTQHLCLAWYWQV